MKLRPVLTVGAVGSLIAVGSVVPAHAANGQEVEDLTNSSAEALAQSLVGENIVVESATYTGADEASGAFTGFADAIGIKDRKSTRLNSSHVAISYAVFCLKKKRKMSELRSCLTCTVHESTWIASR